MCRPPQVEKPLFFLDYDGTLAPFSPDPKWAWPHPVVPGLLTQLAERYPVWIVTGRQLEDLDRLLPVDLPAIGLHGLQEGRIGGPKSFTVSDALRQLFSTLRQQVPKVPGLWVEDKGPTFALHYRQASDEAAVLAALEPWLAMVPDTLAIIRGKKVIELRPRAVHKGTAVLSVARSFPDHVPVYLGDDATDEDAFRALAERGLTIKIGEGPTAAQYRLPSIEAAVAYLQSYVFTSPRANAGFPGGEKPR
ncbi:Trehalose-6-phosphate phosphatase [bacterium HR18]|uniref:Trehalose 6-phosphate phosphatase n=1 Tax=Rhodothermus marinus TaxID=29549 RepID=A0A7V2F5H0_RHOMR|nr:Trehalose-6-phosphate phosphatase [bacterium HR18]